MLFTIAMILFGSSLAVSFADSFTNSSDGTFTHPAPKQSFGTRASSAVTTTVGSYNIHNQGDITGLAADFKQLQDLDVLAMQEVKVEAGPVMILSESLLTLLNLTWRFHCVERVNQNANGTWESLVIASRYPILDCGVLALNHSGTKNRVAHWAKIKTAKSSPLLVINTDHETNLFLTLGYPDRKKQLQSLVNYLNDCRQWLESGCEKWPTLLAGDFNTSEVSFSSPLATKNEIKHTVLFLQKADLKRVAPCLGHHSTFESFMGLYQLDHLFIKNLRSSCRLSLKNRQGSDHFPIWSTLSQ